MFEFMELRSKHFKIWLTQNFYELKILIPVDVFSNNLNYNHHKNTCNFFIIFKFIIIKIIVLIIFKNNNYTCHVQLQLNFSNLQT